MAETGARDWIERIRLLELPGRIRVMNVCGGHERTLSMAGVRSVLPRDVELIPGPGCPVCICPEEDIHLAIQIALHRDATVLTFGDMLRVPTNVPTNVSRREVRTLEEARAAGGRVVPIASPSEVVAEARRDPTRRVIFFAAGFETTMAPVAARIQEGLPDNVELLLSGRRTWPAVAALLERGRAAFDGLVAPGHVAAVMGAEEWRFVSADHGIPTAVSGFRPEQLLHALHSVLLQVAEGRPGLENCYPEAVLPGGNRAAQRLLDEVFEIIDAPWRGIGTLPASGYGLRPIHAHRDARRIHADLADQSRRRLGQMPAGCGCAGVVLGRIYPTACALYGTSCVPRSPVGPCMVSDEGACRIWWAGGIRSPEDLRALHA